MFWLCCLEFVRIQNNFKGFFNDIHQNASLSGSFEGNRSHVIDHCKTMYARLPDTEQQAQYCNQENQQTAEPVHFFHNPKKANKSNSMKSILQH